MGRSRKSDPNAALSRAIELFWVHGYAGVSTRLLEDETGITRFTLQRSLGGKMALFLMAVDQYLDQFEEFAAPDAQPESVQQISDWFMSRAFPQNTSDAMNSGCLMLNTLVEFGAHEPEIAKRMDRYYGLLGGRFEKALVWLQQAGDLRPDLDPGQGAALLQATALAMNVQIRAAGKNAAAEPLANAVQAMIAGWCVSRS
jgi:TetR/AcrR family transcriptional repressor of nem operon